MELPFQPRFDKLDRFRAHLPRIVQIAWMIPLVTVLPMTKRAETAKGVVIFAWISALMNIGLCGALLYPRGH